MSYHHLTTEERYHIYTMKKMGFSISRIAIEINRSKSTIWNELKRNSGQRGYRPGQADKLSEERRKQASSKNRISEKTFRAVDRLLLEYQLSPQQIANRMKLEGTGKISHETIYKYIYADKKNQGRLWLNLRSQKK